MRIRMVLVLIVASAVLSSQSYGLTDEEVFRDFRFNLINPGARAMGLGGAFLSLADDATAAQANPSGLSFLLRSEFFVEMRAADNAAQSSVVTETLPTEIDTFVATGTDFDDSVNMSFLSGVLARKKWSVGFSRQVLVNISNSTLSSFAFTFPDSPGAFLVEGVGQIDADVVNWNASFGWRLSNRWGIGATVAYSTLDVRSDVTNTIIDTNGAVTTPLLEPTLDLRTTIDDQDDDIVFSLGVLYRVTGKWSVGALYRQGPDFAVEEVIASAADANADGEPDGIDVFEVEDRLGARFNNQFSLPDTIAVGGSWNPMSRLTLTAEIQRILYSDLLDGYVSGVNVLTTEDAQFTVDDGTDYRAGVEYVFLNRENWLPTLALRGGLFTEESAKISATSTGTDSFATEDVFGTGGRQEHATLGIGFAFSKEFRYKLDAAADFSEARNAFLLSFIYKMKR